MDIQTLHNILLHTFAVDTDARKAAEAALLNLHTVRGSIVLLMQLISNLEVQKEIRQAAGIQLKNIVSKHWEGQAQADDSYLSPFTFEDKLEYRKYIMEGLLTTGVDDRSIRSLLAEAVNQIARIDFPMKWPGLVEEITTNIQSGDPTRICNALLVLRRLCKNYEYRNDENRADLNTIVGVTFPLLLTMLESLVHNHSVEGARMIHLICKIFWSCVQVSLPPYVTNLQRMSAWMDLFRQILAKRLPEASESLEPLHQPTDPDAREKWPWWKVKKWILQVVTRFYMRWGNPKSADPENVDMAKHYRSHVNPPMLATIMETLALRKQGLFCTDRVMQLSLTYVNEAVKSSQAYKQLKPHLHFLLFEVVHPTLCLTPVDMQLWADDPHEFVRKTHDFMEGYLSPVNAAQEVLNSLCTLRGKDCLSNVLMFYNQILSTYVASPVESRDVIQKEAALHGLSALQGLLVKSKAHKPQIEALLQAHVLPEFHNPHGFLRLRACKMFTGDFMTDIVFADATITELANSMMKSMADVELPVRIEAAKALRHLVMYEHSTAVLDAMRPVLPQIMEQYFKLMDEIGNDEVVIALEHIIDQFADEIGPYAVQLVGKLVDCFNQFAKEGDEDDDACMTAASCLDTVNTILYSIHNQPEYYPLFLDSLVPAITLILSSDDYTEYLESALDVLVTLTFYSKSIAPSLWSLFPLLFTAYQGWAEDYITNFVSVIDNYIGMDVTNFLAGGVVSPTDGSRVSYLEMVFQLAANIFKQSDDEQDDRSMELVAACKLLYSLLHNCLRHDINVCVPLIVQITCLKLARSLKQKVVTSLFGVIASALHYNPALTLTTMESFQATDPLFKAWLSHLPKLTKFMDQKMFVLGITAVFKLPLAELPLSLQPHTHALLVGVVDKLRDIQTGDNDEDEGSDGGDGDDNGLDEDEVEQLVERGGYGSDEDAEALQDADTAAFLREMTRRTDDDDDDGYYFGMGEEEEFTSELDNIDEFAVFLETVQHMLTTNPQACHALQMDTDEFKVSCEVVVVDGKLDTWLFTAKTGEVLRKKAFQPSDIADRFSRISLANAANVHSHAAILRRSNGSCIVWDVATLAQGVETPLDKHVVALQVPIPRPSRSVYRHEVKTVLSTDQHARLVQSTCKLMQHQMSGPGPSIVVDAPLPDQTLKSNATAINTRLHAITMLVRQHLEIWLSWIPTVIAKTNHNSGAVPLRTPSPTHPPSLIHHKNGWLATAATGLPSMEQLVFDAAEATLLEPPTLDKDTSSSTSHVRVDDVHAAAQRRASATHFTLKPTPAAPSSSKPLHHPTTGSGFPTPFKCCGDFCGFDLSPPSSLVASTDDALTRRRRRGIHALLSPEDSAALGAANLLQTLTNHSVDTLQNYNDQRLHYTITYRSIALAKANKAHLVDTQHSDSNEADVVSNVPNEKKPAYMASTVSKDWQRSLGKTYGELDGGAANYYRHVKVCRSCYAVYSTLDTARRMLDEVAAKVSQQLVKENARQPPGMDKWNQGVDASVAAKERGLMGRRSSSTTTLEVKLPRLGTPPEGPPSMRILSAATSPTTQDDVGEVEGRGMPDDATHPPNVVMPLIHQPSSPTLSQPQHSYATSKAKSTAMLTVSNTRAKGWKKQLDHKATHAASDEVAKTVEALKCAQETHYDAIVCGRDVPTLGAIEMTKLLRQHEIQQSIALHLPVRRTPVLCFTNCTSPEDLRVYMEVGMDGCVGHPLDLDALRRMLEAAVTTTGGGAVVASLQAIVAKANQPIATSSSLPKPASRPRKKKPAAATATGTSSNLANALLGHAPDDPSCTMGMFQVDADTSLPFAVLNPPTPPTTINTFFNLVVVHDIFDTMERMQIFLQPMLARCSGAQALVWNYPGQAGTTWRKGLLLNNAYLSTCLSGLLSHGLWRHEVPFYLVGYGNGGPVCLHYALHAPSPSLRALVSVNGFAYVDSTLATFLHDAIKVFSCSPPSRPDLPVYYHTRFLFSGAYLATVSTPLALNLYTAVSNPITLDGRVALCLGALSHVDVRHDLSSMNVPLVVIASAQDGLVQPLHVDAIVAARGGGSVNSIHKVLKHHRKSKTCVVWVQAGHEVFQEVKPTIAALLEQFLTGFHETHDSSLTTGTGGAAPRHEKEGSLVAAAAARTSYEDHFINKVMMTLTDVKDRPGRQQPPLNPHVHPRAPDDGETNSNAWAMYQQKRMESTAATHSAHNKKKSGQHPPPSVLDPLNPSFERDTNDVYRAGDGSKIYPDPTTRGDIKEYMQWRVQRNATRLQRMHKLASKIQKAYRAYRARTLADRLRRHKAALTMQRVYRGFKGRLVFDKRRREDAAIRLVQRSWRGKMGRMQFKSTKSQRLAAIEMQRMVRGHVGRLRVRRIRTTRYTSACIIQALFRRRVYRGHVGRARFRAERDRYLFSKAQTQNIDFGKQMLLEYKLYGTRLQSEVALLVNEKTKAEASVESLLVEIAEFEAGVRVLETEMHALSQIETEATGVLDEQAKWQLRDQKMRLDQEFAMMLKKIADRREKLLVLGTTLQALDKSRHAKEEDLRGLERKLVLLLDEQQRQLQGIKAKQEKRSQVLVDVAGGVIPPGPLGGVDHGQPGGSVSCGTTVSPEQRQEANSLMESTETMMKFGFMSMSMTYFSSMNMIKAMRQIGAHHTFLDSANAIHNHATGAAGMMMGGGSASPTGKHMGGGVGGSSSFHAEPAPGNFPGQEPLLASAWSVRDVGRWLDTLSLGQYKQAFSDGTVDGSLLYDLNDHDLRFSLGIEYDLHRKKILQAVERLKRAEGAVNKLYSSPLPTNGAVIIPAASSAASVQQNQSNPSSSGSMALSTTSPLPSSSTTNALSTSANQVAATEPPPLVIRFDEVCSLVRNGKLKQVKEAFEKWPDKAYDDLSTKVQNAPGTIYEDSLEHQAFHMNKADEHGNSLLLLAAQNNLLKVCQFLVSKGANPNHQNKQGQSAGHYAMAYSFFDLGAWLLDPDKGGGRDDLVNIHGLTAYDGLSPAS
ncbi:hypothetical protein DYB34_002793 [Aphanomyces astaci]|uniref:Importin N-terminal domain-containing protein n=1 Tax=Aphanomyces astaci TaxID=112090 RepID=A0A418C0Y5_APHAT|nr:hypothetical protein DYB34_002793 [Aphanomyces astaci]